MNETSATLELLDSRDTQEIVRYLKVGRPSRDGGYRIAYHSVRLLINDRETRC